MGGMKEQAEIEKALYGRKKGARIRVKEDPAQRTADGIVFHSRHEMNVYLQFAGLLRARTIIDLQRQVPFPIRVTDPNGKLVDVFKWIADFVVTDRDRVSIIDAKGYATETYKLKKKLVEAQYGIRIIEL